MIGTCAAAVALAGALALLLLSSENRNPPHQMGPGATVPAQNVVGSIGVNIHLSYFSTAYGNFPAIATRLKALGVRNVRDVACSGCTLQNQRLRDLGAAGIRLNLVMGDPTGRTGKLPQLLALVRGPLRPYVASVEGPNEYDNSGDPNWAPRLKAYQQELYRGIKSDPRLRGLPVFGPSLVHPQSYGQLGNISRSDDAASVHAYPPNGQPPMLDLPNELRLANTTEPSRPVISTETGYRTGGPPQPGNRPVSEAREAAYLTDLVLGYYRAGVKRSFIYELVDEKPDPSGKDSQQHFGLLRNNFSPKPAYFALHNLISLLSAGGPARGSLDAPRATASSSGGSRMQTLTMQRGDGSQVLAIWPTDPSAADAVGKAGRTHPVQIALSRRAPLALYRPAIGPNVQRRLASATQATVRVGADPLLVVVPRSG
jgi:hypothetical protein